MSTQTEVQTVVKAAETVAADVAKAPAEVKSFWSKYGSFVTHALTALFAAYAGHAL